MTRSRFFLPDGRPAVMGILNATPDSFHAGSRFQREAAVQAGIDMVQHGADLLDLGGQSSRPGAERIGADAEWDRVGPVLEGLKSALPDTPVSVDTFHATVARRALAAGASIVNDISAGTLDPDMPGTVAEFDAPFIAMHMQGTPETMQDRPLYTDVMAEVRGHLEARLKVLHDAGIRDIAVDPGFGFGKTLAHNYALLQGLPELKALGCPLLVGVSRKSMIHKALGIAPADALNGTTALHAWALDRGADILRVHDVREAVECVRLHQYLHGRKSN